MKIICESCGREFVKRGSRGRVPRFCGQTCRKRASRAARGTEPWMRLVAATRGRWTRAGGPKGKRPMQVNGRWASSTNPATWSDFDEVLDGPGTGFGVMMGTQPGESVGVAVYDLDGVLDEAGNLAPWAREALNRIEEPILFAEVSKSGRGVHVFVESVERPGIKPRAGEDEPEFYSHGRFVCTTLRPFDMSVVE